MLVGRVLLNASVLVLASACAGPRVMVETGYRSSESPFQVPYADADARTFLPRGWRLANFRLDDEGEPREITRGRFTTRVPWEWKDGSVQMVETKTYELLFEHTTNATIWVRLLPLPVFAGNKQTRVLAENYVNELAQDIQTESFRAVVAERHISTKLLSSEPTRAVGHPAHRVQFEVVNLNQLQHDADAPRTKVEMVFVSAPFRKAIKGANEGMVRARLVFGYANDDHAFDSQVGAFRALVERASLAPADPQ